ncbi:MAG: aminodeoxychorismate/anthranilate synthase component II [Bacteroidales bacterium]
MKNCLLIDCYDSFTHKLAQSLEQTGLCRVTVLPHDKISTADMALYDCFVLSPGPGLPHEYPGIFVLMSVLREKPVLGVCMGHQLMALYCGGSLAHLPDVVHGQKRRITFPVDDVLFADLPAGTTIGLYHSWHISRLPQQFSLLASSDENIVMAISHETYPWTGLQFHPESYMSSHGVQILANWIRSV